MRCSRISRIAALAVIASLAAACGSQPPAAPSTVTVTLPPVPVAPPPPAQLAGLALTSDQAGYGLFAREDGTACQVLSATTTDGGAQFRSAASLGVCGTVDSISVDAAGTAFAYGPDLFVKASPASPWRRSPQPGTVLAVSAVGTSVWMLLARCHGTEVTVSGCTLELAESADSGRTWQPPAALPSGAVTAGAVTGPSLAGLDAGQTWLVRTGLSTGYVMAAPVISPGGQQDSAPLWYTADSGATWSQRHLDCGVEALSVALAAAPDGTLAAVCAGDPSGGSQVKTTAVSADGGLHWQLHPACLQQRTCDSSLDGGYLGQLAAVSAQRMYLVGSRSPLLVTTDGGVHWQVVGPLSQTAGDGTAQVSFLSRSDGIVVTADGTIYRTSDGGTSWSKVVPQLLS